MTLLLLYMYTNSVLQVQFYNFLRGEIEYTSLQTRTADLPASPAGLLGRFAPSGFALRARISLALLTRVLRFALTKIFEKKKCVSIDLKCSKTHKNAKKIFTPFDP